jgi:WD40 repeat protein
LVRSSEPSDWIPDLRTDVLLITVTTIEAQTVLNLFAKERDETFQRHFIGDKTYFNLGILSGARIMMVQSEMGAGGLGGALLVIDESIRALSPSAVIIVGIAFGIDDKQQHIGDILVSQQLLGYELQKIATGNEVQVEVIPRDDRPHASVKLLDRFRCGVLGWHGPKVEFGLLLSGDKLVDNQNFRDQLCKLAPEAIGGEIEGTGLYASAQRKKIDWIVVKAICDWADGNKEQEKSIRQQLAAENAVRFTLHVLRLGGFVTGPPNIFIPPMATSKGSSTLTQDRGSLLRQYDVHASWVVAVAWEPNGTCIASAGGDGTVRVWEMETGESLLTYRGHRWLLNKMNLQTTVYTVAWAPEGLRIVSAGNGTNIYVWNAVTGQTLTCYQGHSGWLPNVYAAVWSPDGKYIASVCSCAGMDKTVHIWDATTGQTLSRYDASYGWTPKFSVLSVAWSPDGTHIAATCGDKTIRIWNMATGCLASIYRFRSEWSSHIAWSPDSRYIAAAYSDHTVQVWDTLTEESSVIYHEHTDNVRCVAWSPDGTSIATASNDRTVQIWEPVTGRHIYTYRGHSHWATSVAWSPDGTRIASASNDKTIHIWHAVDKAKDTKSLFGNPHSGLELEQLQDGFRIGSKNLSGNLTENASIQGQNESIWISSKYKIPLTGPVQGFVQGENNTHSFIYQNDPERSRVADQQAVADESPPPLKLFYCYAREDLAFRNELDTHLAGLRRSGLITTWYDGEIVAGFSWEQEIENHLNAADIILLLVSPSFIKSDYCYSKEMQQALERHATGSTWVVPILLRPVDWAIAPFSHLQMLPSNARFITRWRNRDEAYENVAKGLRRVVNVLFAQRVTGSNEQERWPAKEDPP